MSYYIIKNEKIKNGSYNDIVFRDGKSEKVPIEDFPKENLVIWQYLDSSIKRYDDKDKVIEDLSPRKRKTETEILASQSNVSKSSDKEPELMKIIENISAQLRELDNKNKQLEEKVSVSKSSDKEPELMKIIENISAQLRELDNKNKQLEEKVSVMVESNVSKSSDKEPELMELIKKMSAQLRESDDKNMKLEEKLSSLLYPNSNMVDELHNPDVLDKLHNKKKDK